MKRFSLMIAAMMLLMVFTQCKKDNVTPTSDQGVRITLTAGYGQGGEKTDFNGGSFVWSDGTEYINVGGSISGYLGYLEGTGDGSSTTIPFSGSLDKTPVDGETLYFFYLGNGDHTEATTLDFSKQNGTDVTDCHIAIGRDTYTTGKDEFSAELEMAMAIAYFDLSGFDSGSKTAETVYLRGDDVYTTATINYNSGTITPNAKGNIKVGTAGSDMYVAMIPSVSTPTTLQFNSKSKTGSIVFQGGIQKGKYYSKSGAALAFDIEAGSGIPGAFSVSADKQVFFSPGNLQYRASDGTWRFAEHQYDAIGNNAGNNNFTDSRSTQSDWIDLFGWGTSGWNNGNTDYLPYNNYYTTSAAYGYGYGPRISFGVQYSLTGEFADADWGVHNSISNGGSGWRTLTGGDTGEWWYLLNSRSASTINDVENARYAKAKVNNCYGVIVFPDVYSHPLGVALPRGINSKSTDGWDGNDYDETDWGLMAAAGAVFLPLTGNATNSQIENNSTNGYYWSSTHSSENKYAYGISFVRVTLSENAKIYRYYGCAVRLVRDVE